MIIYPSLKKGATIGVTAPSSGVPTDLHGILNLAFARMVERGYKLVYGDTIWNQDKAKSAHAIKRAKEFISMMDDEKIDLIIPPWGGELLVEILPYINFEKCRSKWILGYSDTSVLLLALTLQTGIATAHGTNLVDLRGEYWDETTAMWEKVLLTKFRESILQSSSEAYQKVWQHDNPSPCVFHLTEPTYWRTTTNKKVDFCGRLLGGCIDVIRHLIGTPFGDVNTFRKKYISDEPILWYFENCELTTTDLRRTLIQMKLAGWFQDCPGIMFGRSAANKPVGNYMVEDVYKDLSDELNIPIVFDIDCGHVPPQITFVNGAYAEVEVKERQGQILQTFR